MATTTRIIDSTTFTRLLEHLRTPLYRNGYALVLSSALTSGLGIIYWVLAARSYSEAVVGVNSAVMAAMIFLANVSQLNLMNALNRFLPRAGRSTTRLILYAYLISTVIALGTSLIFVAGVELWSPGLSFLNDNPLFIIWFTLATMTWCLFVLQDSVLVGLREATWVPFENLLFALGKIGLLILLAAMMPGFGVLASWTVPVLILLVPTNYLIFRRLIPKHVAATEHKAEPIVPRQIARYVAGDYLSSWVWMALTNLLPLIVLERAGATANAYFYMTWTIAYSLYLVSRNMGMSLISEAAADPEQMASYTYRTFIQTSRMLVPMVAVCVVGAPLILQLFGDTYAEEAAWLLRLLCLSAIPNVITAMYISVARVQRRMLSIVVVFGALCSLVLTLSLIFLDTYGVTGVGLAWLIGQSVIAIALVITQMRYLLLSRLNVNALLRLLSGPIKLWHRWQTRSRAVLAAELTPQVLPTVAPYDGLASPETWVMQDVLPTVNDLIVARLGSEGQPAAILKLAQTPQAKDSLQQQSLVLTELQNVSRLADWRSLIPTLLAQGQVNDHAYTVERLLPGIEASQLLAKPDVWVMVEMAVARAIGGLHRSTATQAVVDSELLACWVDEPLSYIRSIYEARGSQSHSKTIDALATELHDALQGRIVTVSWVHGDLVPGNILVTPDGLAVTGLVDWELAMPDELPQLDLILLFLSTQMLQQRRELGDVVSAFIRQPAWTVNQQALLKDSQAALGSAGIEMRTLILLTWLRHVGSNLRKSARYARHRLWIAKNIESVLGSV